MSELSVIRSRSAVQSRQFSAQSQNIFEEAPERPNPPIVGKVTHHSIELYWTDALEAANKGMKKGDGRIRLTVQEEEKSGGWGTVYSGYAKSHIMEGLEPWSQYKYRLRFMNQHGNSDWSPSIIVSTTKEPLTGEHLHRCINLENCSGLIEVLDTGEVEVETPDKFGFSPLMQASQKGYIDMIVELVEHGADANACNDAGKTSLMLAAFAGRLLSVKELRHYGAKYEAQDRGGSTALHWAADGKNTELIEWMIDDGADVNVRDYSGWTPLIRNAAVTGDRSVGKMLTEKGADVNAKDKDGKTALMIAVINGHTHLVDVLLDANADLTVKNEYGRDIYDMASSMERNRIQQKLKDHMEKLGMAIPHY